MRDIPISNSYTHSKKVSDNGYAILQIPHFKECPDNGCDTTEYYINTGKWPDKKLSVYQWVIASNKGVPTVLLYQMHVIF